MTAAEAQTRLAAIEAQLDKIYASGATSAYGINGRNVQKNLEWLSKERDRLEAIIARASSGTFLLARFREAN